MNALHIHYCQYMSILFNGTKSSLAANNMIFVYNLPTAISLESDPELIDG